MKICIHGHFYQPPREDPFSNYIPDETGAEPFRNWNERILFECYQPNAKARNFEKLSFNVGPTLFNWLADFDPEVSDMIIEQEQECDCDLIVVGKHGESVLEELLLGSVTKHVLAESQCDVLVSV